MDIQQLSEEMHRFVTAKGWYLADSPRPQTPRNIALSLAIEAAEVLEHFQWGDTPLARGELANGDAKRLEPFFPSAVEYLKRCVRTRGRYDDVVLVVAVKDAFDPFLRYDHWVSYSHVRYKHYRVPFWATSAA